MSYRRHGSLLGSLFRIVLVLLLVLLVFLGWSAYRMYGAYKDANAAYQTCEKCMENYDYTGALSAVQTIGNDIATIEAEIHGWQWELMRNVPVIGEDVSCVQQMSDIADALANDALLPVLAQAQVLFGDTSQSEFSAIVSERAGQIEELTNRITVSRGVVANCKAKADALPQAHIVQINELANNLRQAVAEVNQTLEDFAPALDVLDVVGDVAGLL